MNPQIKSLYESLTSSSERRERQGNRFLILNDDAEDLVKAAIDARFIDSEEKKSLKNRYLDLSNNSYRYITSLLSIVYYEPAKRTFVGELGAEDTELFRSLLPEIDTTMETVNQLTMAENECFVRPVVRGEYLDLDILPAHSVEVISDGPRLEAIIYPMGETYCVWDSLNQYLLDQDGNLTETIPHPYGRPPFIVYRRIWPISGYWSGPNGEDLVSLYLSQCIYQSYLQRLGYYQSFKQLVLRPNVNDSSLSNNPRQQASGPHTILHGDYTYLDMQANLEQLENAIAHQELRAARNYGISAEVLTHARLSSGLERLLSHQSLQEQRQRTIKLFRPSDLALMELITKVWNASSLAGSPKFTTETKPRIDYAEPRIVKSALDELKELELGASQGVVSLVDYVMRNDPDLASREDALAKIEQNLEELSIVREQAKKFAVPQEQINAAMGKLGGRPPEVAPGAVSTELRNEPTED